MNEELKTVSALAIIPARGGSKGIPGKNIRRVAGRPLVAHSIAQARGAVSVKRVVVSTDSDDIAGVAERFGAEVVRRPADISGDRSPSEAALRHVLDTLAARDGYRPDLVVFLQATSPCRLSEDIDGAVSELLRQKADSLFSACPEHFTGRWRVGDDGAAHPVNYEHGKRPMRQAYPIEYLENGSIYVFKPDVLLQGGSRMGGRIAVFPMPAWRSFQIDEPGDLETAALIMQKLPVAAIAPAELAALQLLVMDFDGVMTDNCVTMDETGREAVACWRSDGLGISRLRKSGLAMLVISTETNPVVAARCRKLGIECLQGVDDKRAALEERLARQKIDRSLVAFMGNDENDRSCLEFVGLPIVVADAYPDVIACARWVTQAPGGRGAVREVADRIVEARTQET